MEPSSTAGSDEQVVTRLKAGELAGTWTLDPARSSVALRSRSIWGLVGVKGVFTELSGQAQVTADGQVTGTLTVGAASINTKNKKRDTHLRSDDFFGADQHPSIVYTLRSVTAGPGAVSGSGDLQIRDVTRPLDVPFHTHAAGEGIELHAEIDLDRSDFGMNWKQMGTSMKNHLTVTAVFERQA